MSPIPLIRVQVRILLAVLLPMLSSLDLSGAVVLSNLDNRFDPPNSPGIGDIHNLFVGGDPFAARFTTGTNGFVINSVTLEFFSSLGLFAPQSWTNITVGLYQEIDGQGLWLGDFGSPTVNPKPTQWPKGNTQYPNSYTTYIDFHPTGIIALQAFSDCLILVRDPKGSPSAAGLLFSVSSNYVARAGWQMGLTTTSDRYADGEILKLAVDATVVGAPIIKVPLDSGVLLQGSSTNLASGIVGDSPLSFQWFFNDQPIPGATNDIYAIPYVSATNTATYGIYTVTASNALGVVTNGPGTFGLNNVTSSNFVGLVLTEPQALPVQLQSASSFPGSWSLMAELTLTPGRHTYIDFTATNVNQRFYRTARRSGVLLPDRLETWLFPGWTLTNAAGSQVKVEYVNAQLGFTNWQFLTNLTLPSSPYLFVDTSATNKWPRYYRTTPLP